MASGGRTLRSKRKLPDPGTSSLFHDQPHPKYQHLSEPTILTPPPSQPIDEGRKTRRGRSSGRQLSYQDTNGSPMKTRHGAGSSSTLDASSSSGASETSLATFHAEEISLDYGFDMWPHIGGLASENDPFMHKGSGDSTDSTSVNRSRDLHTPTPPMSPDMLNGSDVPTPLMNRPDTPTIRPETPGDMGNPLTPMDGSLVSSSMDATSLVETSSMIGYGPPPTPMCPPARVGTLSSSSSLCVKLPLSSSASTAASLSAAPPVNILDSEGETDEEHDNDDDDNNDGTHNPTHINNNQTNSSNPNSEEAEPSVDSYPPSPATTLSKHSQRLRIRAPLPRSRSCRSSSSKSERKGEPKKVPRSHNDSEQASQVDTATQVTRSILKSSSSSTTDLKPPEVSKIKLNFLNKTRPLKKVSYSDDVQGRGVHGKKGVEMGGGGNQKNARLNLYGIISHASPSTSEKASRKRGTWAPSTSEASTSPPATSSLAVFQSNGEYDPHDERRMQDGCFRYLRLRHFMTHKDLICKWKGNITFLNGQNGSGKSAILTACQLLVGYKAANTNRTTSVTGFIKKGCKYAVIEGWLCNYNGSINKEKYGEVIMLSRRINISGSSIYKIGIPGENKERIVYLQEMMEIRVTLQIDPNNPIQFLQQERGGDNSKTGSSRGQKKDFQMLKDATHLTSSEITLKESHENFEASKREIKEKKDHRKFLVLQEKQLKETCDLIRQIEESETCVQKLVNEMKWAEVKVREENQIDIKSKKEETFLEIKDLKEDKKKLEDEMKNFSSIKEKAKKTMTATKKEVSQYSADREAKINEQREVTKTLHRVQNEYNLILKAIKGYSKKITELEAQLNEDTISYEEQNQVYQTQIERCQAMIPEKEKQLEKLREKGDSILAELNEFKAREAAGMQNVKKLENELRAAKKELNKKDNFGTGMRELLQKIQRTSWNIEPVGPLGAHILVSDERYAPLVEHILGYAALFAFVVQTQEDFRKIRALIAEVYGDNRGKGREPTLIHIARFDVNDYMKKLRKIEDKLASAGFRTVLSMLTIKDPMVKAGIIERTSCERIIVFENNTAAAAVMKFEGCAPRELSHAYTLQWYKVTPYPRYQFQPINPVKRHTEIIPMAKASSAIHINEEIAREKEVIQTCRASMKGYKDGRDNRLGLDHMLERNNNEIKEINKEINQLKNRINAAQSMIKKSPAQGQDNNIQNQIKAEQDMRAEQEMKIQVRLQEVELAKAGLTRIAQEKSEIESLIAEGQKKLAELEGEYNNAIGTVTKFEKEMEGYRVRIERLEKMFHQLSLQDTNVTEDINEKIKEAVETGERPKILERNSNEVRRELEQMKVFLDSHKDIVQSKKRVNAEYMNSKALVRQITTEINNIESLSDIFEPYLKVALDYLEKRKQDISNLLESNYQALAEAHGLTGKLMVDWRKEMLIYYVSPDQHSDARARQNFSIMEGEVVMADKQGMQNYCSNLSGGERAKAQVFFIMSMWEITDLPCHFVDEFETFMDEPSRINIQKLFIKHAKKHTDKQFFFFTPQILIGVPKNDPAISIMLLRKKG